MKGHFTPWRQIALLACVCMMGGALALTVDGRQDGGKNESQVKLSATAGKIEANGRQVITIKMDINKGWHAYANPVKNEDYKANATDVKVTGAKKLEAVAIEYPPGQKYVAAGESFQVYKDSVNILATVTRAAGDTGPLEVSVRYVTCDDNQCLPPETVKLQVK